METNIFEEMNECVEKFIDTLDEMLEKDDSVKANNVREIISKFEKVNKDTIEEDYCSFEISNLLKEKGFDVPTYTFYNPRKSCFIIKRDSCLINRNAGSCVSAPTPQMVMKWLREVYRIEIHIVLAELKSDNSRTYQYDIFSSDVNNDFKSIQGHGFSSFEKAGDAAIKYCLTKLI